MQYFIQRFMERLPTREMRRFEPFALDFSPQRFDGIQVWAVGGQKSDVEGLRLPVFAFSRHNRRVMKPRIVEYHNRFLRYFRDEIV